MDSRDLTGDYILSGHDEGRHRPGICISRRDVLVRKSTLEELKPPQFRWSLVVAFFWLR